jgi:hypothetical protein
MSIVVIIAIVVAVLIVVARVAVYVRRRVSRDRSCASGGLLKPPDTVKRQTPMPPGPKNWAPEPRLCAGKPPRPPPPPRWRSPAPRS